MAPRMTRARAAAQAAMIDIHVEEHSVETSTSATESSASSPGRQPREALKVVTGNAELCGDGVRQRGKKKTSNKTQEENEDAELEMNEKHNEEKEEEEDKEEHNSHDETIREVEIVDEHIVTPTRQVPATSEGDENGLETAYFPDYEHGSPVRSLAPALTHEIFVQSAGEETRDQLDALPTNADESTRTSLLASLEQLSIQNDYNPANDEEIAERSIKEVLQVPASPTKEQMSNFSLELEHTYTPASNASDDHDPYIPDYEASTIQSPTRSRFEHIQQPEQHSDDLHHEKLESRTEMAGDAEDAASTSGSSEAAQRLESLFSPMELVESGIAEGATIANLLSRPASVVQGPVDDPIKALDKLQDAINEVEESLPILAPTPKKAPVRFSVAPMSQTPRTKPRRESRVSVRQSIVRAHDSQEHKFVPASEAGRVKSAISALHTPPPLAKSSKPVTKSSFQLPGEAIAARLKQQREERLKKEEEEAKKRKEFKARPMLKLTKTVEVKTTITSKTRVSMMSSGTLKEISRARLNMASGRPSLPLKRTSSTATSKPKNSTVRERRPPQADVDHAKAKTSGSSGASIRRNGTITSKPAAQHKQTSVPNQAAQPLRISTSAPQAAAPTTKTIDVTKKVHASGAEVFKRPMLQKAAEDKALKEKIEAQKKARAEAAERSRQLSREYAEKKKSTSKQSSRNVSGTSAASGNDADKGVTVSAAAVDA